MSENATEAVLSDVQKQYIERVYGSVITTFNILTVVYIIRSMKGRTLSEASYYLQLLYISTNDAILGTLILTASLITTTNVHSASACQVVVFLLASFNCSCQMNMLFACIQRYIISKKAFMPTQNWKTSYTNRLAVSNLLIGMAIFCIFFTLAVTRDSGYSSERCVTSEVATSTPAQYAMSGIALSCIIAALCASNFLLVLTFRSLRRQIHTNAEQSTAALAQQHILKTLATMAFFYNVSVLPVLINIPLSMFIGFEDINKSSAFISWFVYSNSLFSPLIVLTRTRHIKQLVTNDARYVRSKVGELFHSCFSRNRVEHAETLEL